MATKTERWVYVGRSRLVGGILGYGFMPLVDGKVDGEAKPLWYQKLRASMSAGAIYDVKVTRTPDKITVDTGSMSYVGRHEGPEVADWRAKSEAEEIVHRTVLLEAKDNRQNELLDALLPLRRAYQKTDHRGRQALQVLLLDYLRRPVE